MYGKKDLRVFTVLKYFSFYYIIRVGSDNIKTNEGGWHEAKTLKIFGVNPRHLISDCNCNFKPKAMGVLGFDNIFWGTRLRCSETFQSLCFQIVTFAV